MRIFATLKKFHNNEPYTSNDCVWTNVRSETGEDLGDLISNINELGKINVKIGNRYQIICENIWNFRIMFMTNIKHVNKNPKCNIFRRFKDEFHIVGGKHSGKKDNEVDKAQLMKYCIWLGKNSYNEATIINALNILKRYAEK